MDSIYNFSFQLLSSYLFGSGIMGSESNAIENTPTITANHTETQEDTSFEKVIFETQLNSIEDTISRYDELTSKGRWEGRLTKDTFDELEKQLSTCSQKDAPQFRLRLSNLYKKFESLNTFKEGGLTTLITDIQIYIFSFCAVQDIGRLISVSKNICLLANTDSIWKSLCQKEEPSITKDLKITWKQCYEKEIDLREYEKGSQIFVKNLRDKTMCVTINLQSEKTNGLHLKKIIKKRNKDLTCNLSDMRIIMSGKELTDSQTLKPLKLQEIACLHLITPE